MVEILLFGRTNYTPGTLICSKLSKVNMVNRLIFLKSKGDLHMLISETMSFVLAFPVLYTGKWLNQNISLFRKFHIPEPVSGGLLFSIILILIEMIWKIDIDFDTNLKSLFLLWFFSTIGLSSNLKKLISGGKPLLIMLFLASAFLFLQNLVGIGISFAVGGNPILGLIGGSISLTGGHGTALAWSTVFEEEYGLISTDVFGAITATFGLILGGLAGGPLGTYLINKHKLKGEHVPVQTIGLEDDFSMNTTINYDTLLWSLFLTSITAVLGGWISGFGKYIGLNIPPFVYCLLVGIIFTNTIPIIFKRLVWPSDTPSLAIISDMSLGLFLAMAMMGLDIWAIDGAVLPVLLLMISQLLAISLFSIYVIFPILGKNYDAAIITSGFVGMGLGATPTALANMTALTHHFGASPRSFIVIPLLGAFFIDIVNSFVIEFFLTFFI